VHRSQVGTVRHYNEYKEQVRVDFVYSCAYCTISEAEAMGISFTIDHYRPRISHPQLENSYDNLIYCCRECNTRKGDRDPPESAQEAGVRFFRPDRDVRPEHYSVNDVQLVAETDIGTYTVEAIDLNRAQLCRLRNIRRRFAACDEYVAEGIDALRKFRIDNLPPDARVRALKARDKIIGLVDNLKTDMDELLRDNARSGLLDVDPDAEKRFRERTVKLRGYEALFPGTWRGRDTR